MLFANWMCERIFVPKDDATVWKQNCGLDWNETSERIAVYDSLYFGDVYRKAPTIVYRMGAVKILLSIVSCTYKYVRGHACIYMHVRVRTRTCMYIHACPCKYMDMHVCTCMSMYIHVCTIYRRACTILPNPSPVQVYRIPNPFQNPIENVALNSTRPHRFGLAFQL
jgi:hypothetical protein